MNDIYNIIFINSLFGCCWWVKTKETILKIDTIEIQIFFNLKGTLEFWIIQSRAIAETSCHKNLFYFYYNESWWVYEVIFLLFFQHKESHPNFFWFDNLFKHLDSLIFFFLIILLFYCKISWEQSRSLNNIKWNEILKQLYWDKVVVSSYQFDESEQQETLAFEKCLNELFPMLMNFLRCLL